MCAKAKALARLCGCAGSPEPSLVTYMISSKFSEAGSITFVTDILSLTFALQLPMIYQTWLHLEMDPYCVI